MSLRFISPSIKKNILFLIAILIIYFASLVEYTECTNKGQIEALVDDIKKNELGKLMLETYQIDYEVSNGKNMIGFEKKYNSYKDILEYKANEHSYFSQYYSSHNDKCEKEILNLKTKAKALKNTISEENNEKLNVEFKIGYKRKNLNIIKTLRNHYSNKFDLFNKIQKRFFLSKYILLPVLEDLIDFTKYIKVHFLLLKRSHASSDKKEISKIIFDFFNNERFRKLNKNLNLLESESVIILENYLKYQTEVKKSAEDFLKPSEATEFNDLDAAKKCIIFNLEPYANSFLNVDEFFKRNLNSHNQQQFKRIVYCSEYVAFLRYLSIKFHKDYYTDKWKMKDLDKIYKMLKHIQNIFGQKVDLINKQFEELTEKFSGSSSYINTQIKYFQDKEEEIIKEIKMLEEGSFSSNASKDYATETKYLEDLISYKSQLFKSQGSGIELSEEDLNFTNNIKKLNNLISFDPLIIREIYQIKNSSNDNNYGVANDKIISFVELENELSIYNEKFNHSKYLEIEDIDFDAI